jgi:hypothetical protein
MKIILREAKATKYFTGWDLRERELEVKPGATIEQDGMWQIKAVEVHDGEVTSEVPEGS